MRMVVIRIKFTTPCLGSKGDRKDDCLSHHRDGHGRVVFLQSWWDSAMAQAAKAYGRHQNDVRKIRWSPIVDGVTHPYWRHFKTNKAREHEAFRVGDEVAVKALVPPEISTKDFRQLLNVLGEFFGISPFRYPGGSKGNAGGRDGGYGRFEVVEVREHGSNDKTEVQHAGDQSSDGDTAPTVADDDVQKDEAQVRGGSVEVERS
jgi:hypothetical protein